jgi:hypothetical protein
VKPKFFTGFKDSRFGSVQDASELWYNAVRSYSSCGLSKSKDMLPAIAGLARILAAQTGDTYIAGMWKHRLVYQLVWWVSDVQKASKQEYLAPSWSWISRSYEAEFTWPPNDQNVRPLAKMKGIHLDCVSDAFGQLRGGYITLTAMVFDVQILDGSVQGIPSDCALDESRVDFSQDTLWLLLFWEDDRHGRYFHGLLLDVVRGVFESLQYRRVGIFVGTGNLLSESMKSKIDACEDHLQDVVII